MRKHRTFGSTRRLVEVVLGINHSYSVNNQFCKPLHANGVKYHSPGQRPGVTINKYILRATLDGSRENSFCGLPVPGCRASRLPWAITSNAFSVHHFRILSF